MAHAPVFTAPHPLGPNRTGVASGFAVPNARGQNPSVNGSASITEGLDAASGVGTVSVAGVAAITEGLDTVTGVGTVESDGIAAITEGTDTVAASGTGSTEVDGTASIVEGADVVSASGTVESDGIASITEGADAVSASGTVESDGVAAIVEGFDLSSSVGTVESDGFAAIIEAGDIVAASGYAGSNPEIDGAASITEDPEFTDGEGFILDTHDGGTQVLRESDYKKRLQQLQGKKGKKGKRPPSTAVEVRAKALLNDDDEILALLGIEIHDDIPRDDDEEVLLAVEAYERELLNMVWKLQR